MPGGFPAVVGTMVALMHVGPAGPEGLGTVRLSTGEELRVEVVAVEAEFVRVRHPVLGLLDLPVPGTVIVGGPERAAPGPAPASAGTGSTGDPEVPEPEPGWRWSIQFGTGGAEGNAESSNLLGELKGRREAPTTDTVLVASYRYASSDGDTSRNRGELFMRRDWRLSAGRWGLFGSGRAEYDQFQDWRWRLSGFAGPSYEVVRTGETLLRLRTGSGLTRTLGGMGEGWTPEALAGVDFEHKLDERQSVFVSGEYLPSLSEIPGYRVNGKGGYKVVIDPSNKVTLEVGVADRYDSDPGAGRWRNDMEYFLTIGWEF